MQGSEIFSQVVFHRLSSAEDDLKQKFQPKTSRARNLVVRFQDHVCLNAKPSKKSLKINIKVKMIYGIDVGRMFLTFELLNASQTAPKIFKNAKNEVAIIRGNWYFG